MKRAIEADDLSNDQALEAVGLSRAMVAGGITYTHRVLDDLDRTLINNGETRLSQLIELANLSAVIGNLLRGGLAKASGGRFAANKPHKYPDLIAVLEGFKDLEIKVALETNKPKGHLAKPGPHLTCRYVLAGEDGAYELGKSNRGTVPWIWEIRVGVLEERHFNISNTPGDSGKTAVINKEGFLNLQPVYCSLPLCPHAPTSRSYRTYAALGGARATLIS